MVSYARSTYAKAKKFNEKLEELQKTISPATIRAYLLTESEQDVEKVAEKLNLSEKQIAQIEELDEIRKSGIRAEMQYALAQAQLNGVELPEDIISGRAVLPELSKELLEKVPSLGVYNLFLLFTKEELEALLEKD